MAKIIVIANGKGGTGKSTITVQFANYLTSIGKAVAVLDADEGQTVMDMRAVELKNNPGTMAGRIFSTSVDMGSRRERRHVNITT